jgi:hypothetical protein
MCEGIPFNGPPAQVDYAADKDNEKGQEADPCQRDVKIKDALYDSCMFVGRDKDKYQVQCDYH